MRFKKNKGFTLIEVIVVIVILAVLMAVAVPSVMSYIHEADDARYVAVARAAFLNARNGFVHEYAQYGSFGNKQYNKLPTTNQKPDTVLCLKGVGKTDTLYLLLFYIIKRLLLLFTFILWSIF